MAKVKKPRYSFVMKTSVRAKLEELAKEKECSLSEMIQSILEDFIKDK
jgi:hypothetical protein